MPFKSQAQRKWMYANDPTMAKKWESHTPKGKKLPSKVKKKKNVSKEAVSHLKEDIQGYKKQRKTLSHEIKEDKELMKKLKGEKSGKRKKRVIKKKACCPACAHNKKQDCKARKRVKAKKKTRR